MPFRFRPLAAIVPSLYAQFGVAHKVGLSDDAVAALAKGGIPDELSDHEKIAVRLARDLSIHHRVDDALYGAAEKAFGRTGLFDMVLASKRSWARQT
jgi:4-carboxymuconolactone decarboxylase